MRMEGGRTRCRSSSRPGFQGLHERGLNDVFDQGETAQAERPGQHGDQPAEPVAKKVLHQRPRFAHASVSLTDPPFRGQYGYEHRQNPTRGH